MRPRDGRVRPGSLAWRCNIITRISLPASPKTVGKARSSAWRSTEPVAGPPVTSGEAEILVADLGECRREGHLRPLALVGGEVAIREPWRTAAAALYDAGLDAQGFEGVEARRVRAVLNLLARDVACPRATGAGRWFDAAAGLLGVRAQVTYDGQAAVELEAIAAPFRGAPPFPFSVGGAPFVVDLRDAIWEMAEGVKRGQAVGLLAARFHATLVETIVAGCRRVREAHGLRTVVLSGGCFQNRLLAEGAKSRLEGDGFEVLVHRSVPANDGGVALGQAAVAAFRERRV